jgi:hypothetical protein
LLLLYYATSQLQIICQNSGSENSVSYQLRKLLTIVSKSISQEKGLHLIHMFKTININILKYTCWLNPFAYSYLFTYSLYAGATASMYYACYVCACMYACVCEYCKLSWLSYIASRPHFTSTKYLEGKACEQ